MLKGLPLIIRFCLPILVFFLNPLCLSSSIEPIPQFKQEDRILILAPHPDDETIGCAGVIQQAQKAGSVIKTVWFTNGDHNEWAFIVYEKRLAFRKKEFIHMGDVRRKESLAAIQSLGLSRSQSIYLGYPDFGTLEIFTKYWGDTKPFKDVITRISKVPYGECLSPNAAYVGENILKDLKKVILDFHPTKIFVSHPVDTNRDHRALYLFLRVALWELGKQIGRPEIFPYLIHVVQWPVPRGYHPELLLLPPDKLKNGEIAWRDLKLGPKEIQAKNKAISFYKSQIEYEPRYLHTFARQNELFGDFPPIKLKEEIDGEIRWQDTETLGREKAVNNSPVSNLAYARKNKNLLVQLKLNRKIDEDFGITVFLLGYRQNKDFAQMPKIRLSIGINGLRIKDKKLTLIRNDVKLISRGKSLILKIPLSALDNPQYLLVCAQTRVKDLPFEDTAWRIVVLE